MYYIIKRDGVREEFDPEKIKSAVLKAFVAVDGEVTTYAEEITTGVVDALLGLRLRNGPGTGYGITTTLSHHPSYISHHFLHQVHP